MISDAEFVMIKSFDRTVDRIVGQANATITHKDSELGSAGRIIRHLQSKLAAAEARAAAAEARTASLMQQIQNSLN